MKNQHYHEFQRTEVPWARAYCRTLKRGPLSDEAKGRLMSNYRRGFLRICRELRASLTAY